MSKEIVSVVSGPQCLQILRDNVRRFLEKTDFDPKEQEAMMVAVGEACTNAMRHAYQEKDGGKIKVTVEEDKQKVVFKIRDFGQKIDLAKVQKPQLPPTQPHGLGIYFMQTIMDKMEYNTAHAQGNELILIKYKKGTPP